MSAECRLDAGHNSEPHKARNDRDGPARLPALSAVVSVSVPMQELPFHTLAPSSCSISGMLSPPPHTLVLFLFIS